MTTSIRGSNKLIQSRLMSQNRSSLDAAPIPSRVLEKHLTDNEHPIFNLIEGTFDKVVSKLKPFYAVTGDRILQNIIGLITSKWQFELPEQQIEKNMENQKEFIRMSHYLIPRHQSGPPSSRQSIQLKSSIRRSAIEQSDLYKQKYNKSIFMFIWGPLTTIIITHLISNHPFAAEESPNLTTLSEALQINVIAGGMIHLVSMSMISFVMFVLFKVLGATGVQSLFQHVTLASYVGLATILLSIVCSTSMNILIIPFGIGYILGCSYLHVNAYNQALKPQLFELMGVGLLILFFYACTGYMFYHYYHEPGSYTLTSAKQKHLAGLGSIDSSYLHQRTHII